MTDAQIIAIAIVFVAAIGSVMFNNMRITDLRNTLDNRLGDMGKRIDDLRNSVNQRIDDKFTLLSQQMTHMEENILRIVGDHETRIQKLEGRK